MLLVVGVATVPFHHTPVRLAVGFVLIATFALTRPDFGLLWRRGLLAIGAVAALMVPWVVTGDIEHALEVGARASAATLIALAFASTLPLRELSPALRALGVPAVFASTISTMLWQLSNVAAEGRRLVLARKLRGVRGVVGPEILAELFLRSTARAERVELAMSLRGAHSASTNRRTGLGAEDVLGALACGAVSVGLHLLARGGR